MILTSEINLNVSSCRFTSLQMLMSSLEYNYAMHPALFIDRDGVIIENRSSYVRSWSDVSIYPQSLEALRKVKSSGYKLFIITNQSAVGRGIISQETAHEINQRLVSEIEKSGGSVNGVYMCPHAPQDDCSCRKPKPGLIEQAVDEHEVDLSRSILIGDAISDIIAGQTAGVATNVLVLTGRGSVQTTLPLAKQIPPFLTYKSLNDALAELIGSSKIEDNLST
jgi:D-glycero-D-manno-heptose 1,7-bisphosphate phosphatase